MFQVTEPWALAPAEVAWPFSPAEGACAPGRSDSEAPDGAQLGRRSCRWVGERPPKTHCPLGPSGKHKYWACAGGRGWPSWTHILAAQDVLPGIAVTVRTSSRRLKRKKASFPSTHTVALSRGITALHGFFSILPEIFCAHTHTYSAHTMLKLAFSFDKIPSVSFLVTKSMAVPSF